MGRLTLLGIEVDALTINELNTLVTQAVEGKQRSVIGNHNLHSVYLYHRDAEMRRFYEMAQVIHIDGMPLVWWGRLLGYPIRSRHRVTYMDWVWPLLRLAQAKGWTVYHLGGKPGVGKRAAAVVRARVGELNLRVRHGYFRIDGEDNEQVLKDIDQFRPDILMVGMGMPRQEKWVLHNLHRIAARVILTSGACFNYVAGIVPTPPRWAGALGAEWLHRLWHNPRMLWRRYLVEPWALIGPATRDVLARLGRRGNERCAPGRVHGTSASVDPGC